jgi:hypothetical protein
MNEIDSSYFIRNPLDLGYYDVFLVRSVKEFTEHTAIPPSSRVVGLWHHPQGLLKNVAMLFKLETPEEERWFLETIATRLAPGDKVTYLHPFLVKYA